MRPPALRSSLSSPVGGVAADLCEDAKRLTLTADDVLEALDVLDMSDFASREWNGGMRQVLERMLAAYDAEILQADQELGRLFAFLDESGLSENTLVVLTSDHGEGMAAHRWVCKLPPVSYTPLTLPTLLLV